MYVHTPTSWLNRDGGRARIGGWRGGGTVNGWTRYIRWTGWKGNTCNWKDSTWKDRTLNIWTCSGWSGHNWSCCNKWIKREEKKASCSKPFMRVKLAATIYWLWESRLRIIFPTYYNNQVSVVDSRSELTAVSTSPQTNYRTPQPVLLHSPCTTPLQVATASRTRRSALWDTILTAPLGIKWTTCMSSLVNYA